MRHRGEMKRPFALLVFDWDGTLMDSVARIVSCLGKAIDDLGLPLLPAEQLRDVIGLGLSEAIRKLWPEADDGTVDAFAERYRHYFLYSDNTPETFFAGAMDTLQVLRSQGYMLAVATGKSRRGLDRSLEGLDCRSMFDVTRCADESFSKPHPQMLLDIMDQLGVAAVDTLMIGDTEYDLQMAKNAGTPALAVSCGVHDERRLHAHAPLACLASVNDLLGFLDRLPLASHQTKGMGNR